MIYGIITPAYNEQHQITAFMQSVIRQTELPDKLVIVNDNSTDRTGEIAREIAADHDFIIVADRQSAPQHQTGSKVAEAFLDGLARTDSQHWDIIVKLDADLVLPEHYFETVLDHFRYHPDTGICGGVCALRMDPESGRPTGHSTTKALRTEHLTDKYHVRGALKAYRKRCYEDIGGIKPVYGWDTLDELLAAWKRWETVVLPDLQVEHSAPTGSETQSVKLHRMTGELFYRLGYDPIIALAASMKRFRMSPLFLSAFWSYLGYLYALIRRPEPYVTPDQRAFIRKLRYRRMLGKLTGTSENHET